MGTTCKSLTTTSILLLLLIDSCSVASCSGDNSTRRGSGSSTANGRPLPNVLTSTSSRPDAKNFPAENKRKLENKLKTFEDNKLSDFMTLMMICMLVNVLLFLTYVLISQTFQEIRLLIPALSLPYDVLLPQAKESDLILY